MMNPTPPPLPVWDHKTPIFWHLTKPNPILCLNLESCTGESAAIEIFSQAQVLGRQARQVGWGPVRALILWGGLDFSWRLLETIKSMGHETVLNHPRIAVVGLSLHQHMFLTDFNVSTGHSAQGFPGVPEAVEWLTR